MKDNSIRIKLGTLLTTKGLIISLFLLLLVIGPVLKDKDIIASSLSYSLLIIVAFFVLLNLTLCFYYAKNLSVDILGSEEPSLLSQKDLLFVLHTKGLRILPLFKIEVQPLFKNEGVKADELYVTSLKIHEARYPFKMNFPHRGNWELEGLRFIFSDLWGFSKTEWINVLSKKKLFEINPASDGLKELPIVPSQSRPGDSILDSNHRLGEHYDIKAYHPSDGLRKIVWKTFAKTGILLSRHPEPSMTPEGEVAIFLVARTDHDFAASSAIEYAQRLIELDLQVSFSALGQKDKLNVENIEELKSVIREKVWDSNSADICEELTSFASSFQSQLSSIVIFIEASFLSDKKDVEALIEGCEGLQSLGITPHFMLSNISSESDPESPNLNTKDKIMSGYQVFAGHCSKEQWSLIQ